MHWLESQSGTLAGLSSILLTFITAWYAYLTWRLLKENQQMRLASIRPELAIYIKPYEGAMPFVILCIENVGPGPAYEIAFSMDRDFLDGRRSLREVGPFKTGLRYFAPGRRLEHFLVSVIGKLEELKKEPFTISAEYRDALGRSYQQAFVIDFSELENLSQIGSPPLYEIAKAATALQKDVGHLATGFHKMTILTEPVIDYARRVQSDYLSLRIERLTDEDREELGRLIEEKEKSQEGGA